MGPFLRQKSALLFFLTGVGLGGLSSITAVADSPSACTLPRPDADLREVVRWAEAVDDLGGRVLMASDQNGEALRSSLGTLIDPSCRDARHPLRPRRIEAATANALLMAKRCEKKLGIPLGDVISILRRTRISCVPAGEHAWAQAQWGLVHPRAGSRDLEIIGWSSAIEMAEPDFQAQTLFHEALHFTGHNNRSWHDRTQDRKVGGCDRSLFADRIYLISSMCIPRARFRKWFYDEKNGPWKCLGLCEAALTEVDPNILPWVQRTFSPDFQTLLVARPFTREEAGRICRSMRENRKRSLQLREDLVALTGRYHQAYGFLKKRPSLRGAFPGLAKELSSLAVDSRKMFRPQADRKKLRVSLHRSVGRIRKELRRICTEAGARAPGFCSLKLNPIDAFAAEALSRTDGIREDDLLLFTPARAFAESSSPQEEDSIEPFEGLPDL